MLIAVLENLDELDEKFHDEYEEKDGKYYLKIKGIEQHPATAALRSSLDRLKEERRKFLNDVKAKDYAAVIAKLGPIPEDFDIDDYNATKDRVAELEEELKQAKEGKTDPNSEKELTRLREKLEGQIAKLKTQIEEQKTAYEGQISELKNKINNTLTENQLEEALNKAGVKPTLKKAAKAMLRGDIIVDTDDEGNLRPIVKTDMGEVSLDEYVSQWAASDDGKDFVLPPKGTGSNGSDGRETGDENPWMEKSKNLTKQGQIVKTDKAKAKKMMEAAKIPADKIRRILQTEAA